MGLEALREYVDKNYVALCFGIAFFLLVVMLATGNNFLRAISGLAGTLAGFTGLAFLRKRRRTGLDDTPASQPQEQK